MLSRCITLIKPLIYVLVGDPRGMTCSFGAGMTYHGVQPSTFHFMEVQSTMITIIMSEDKARATLHLSLLIVTSSMELTR